MKPSFIIVAALVFASACATTSETIKTDDDVNVGNNDSDTVVDPTIDTSPFDGDTSGPGTPGSSSPGGSSPGGSSPGGSSPGGSSPGGSGDTGFGLGGSGLGGGFGSGLGGGFGSGLGGGFGSGLGGGRDSNDTGGFLPSTGPSSPLLPLGPNPDALFQFP